MGGQLAGKRVLMVDKYLITSDLTRAPGKAGAIPVGPINDVREGSAPLDHGVDAAILDVKLQGAGSYPLVDAMAERQVPYMFVTGNNEWARPDVYRDVPRIAKPLPIGAVVDRIAQLIGGVAVTT